MTDGEELACADELDDVMPEIDRGLHDMRKQWFVAINTLAEEIQKAYWYKVEEWDELARREKLKLDRQIYNDFILDGVFYDFYNRRLGYLGFVELDPKSETQFRGLVNERVMDLIYGSNRPRLGVTSPCAPEPWNYVVTALASGIIGNIGYDALKTAWRARRYVSKRKKSPSFDGSQINPQDALNHLAKIAIREQCQRHNLHVPALKSLTIEQWQYGENSVTAIVVAADRSLRAKVKVPYGNIEHRGVKVHIHQTEQE